MSLVQAIATDPATFSMDGFLALDSNVSAALSIDIDEDGSLEAKRAWKVQN
jgi:hypothetical protein